MMLPVTSVFNAPDKETSGSGDKETCAKTNPGSQGVLAFHVKKGREIADFGLKILPWKGQCGLK